MPGSNVSEKRGEQTHAERRRAGRWIREDRNDAEKKDDTGSIVRATARPESDPDDPREWSWVESSVWTDRMLAALGNGVQGGKCLLRSAWAFHLT